MTPPKPPILKIRRTLAPAVKVVKSNKVYSRKNKTEKEN